VLQTPVACPNLRATAQKIERKRYEKMNGTYFDAESRHGALEEKRRRLLG